MLKNAWRKTIYFAFHRDQLRWREALIVSVLIRYKYFSFHFISLGHEFEVCFQFFLCWFSSFSSQTGTLTEDGLDMWGVVPTSSTNLFQIPLREVERLPYDHLLYGMTTCHSITFMSGELKGDPLDLKMFESTGWILEEANVSDDTKYDLLFPTIVRPPKRPQSKLHQCTPS